MKTMTQENGKNGGIATRTTRRVVDAVTDANTGPYACRKHPNGLSSTMFLNEMDRRYYFEKPTTSSARSKCNLHSRNLAKSLNELYTETAASSSSALLLLPPPPSTMRASGLQLQTQTLPRPPQQFSDSPQEFPLTRSVSTTTDIYATHQNASFSGMSSTRTDCGGTNNNNNISNNNRRRNVATNTRYNSETQTQTQPNGGISTKVVLQQRNNIMNSKKKLPQQLQQQNQRSNNIYQTNFAATTCANNDDLAGDSIDTHNHRLRRATVNGHKIDANNDDHEQDDDDDDDDEEADEEHPQKLCGLKRSIRKTKHELFEEFCKRAGVRPKPKNIYYIDNHEGEDDADAANENFTQEPAEIEEEMQYKPQRLNSIRTGNLHQRRNETSGNSLKHQQQQQKHSADYHGGIANNHIFGDTVDVVDIDENVNENVYKKLTEDEELLYVIDDNIHLMPSSIRSGRRASMYVEPNHLRRLNSNLSLHAIYAPTTARTGLQKSLYDLDTSASDFGYLTAQQKHQQHQPQQSHYALRDNSYGGSQQRLHHDYHNQAMYQSRTLPRTFLKRNAESHDSMGAAGLNASVTQLHSVYGASQQRLTTLMVQQQQQLQQQKRYLSMSREQELYNSRYTFHKSNEELNRHYIQQQQQQPIYIQSHQLQQYQQQQQQQHANVPCTNYSNTSSNYKPLPLVQWPAAIPSSPSDFNSSLRTYGPATSNVAHNINNNHILLTRSNSNASAITAAGQQVVVNGSSTSSQGPPKFQRGYAFDEQRRPSAVMADAFDLDEIERERRRSHASLFTVNSNSAAGVSGGGASVGGVGVASNASKNQDQYDLITGTAV